MNNKYDDTMPAKLLEHVQRGGDFKTFGQSLKDKDGLPNRVSRSTVYKWAEDHPEFAEAKDIAHQLIQQRLFKNAHEIADGTTDIPPNILKAAADMTKYLMRVYGIRDDEKEKVEVDNTAIEINVHEQDL